MPDYKKCLADAQISAIAGEDAKSKVIPDPDNPSKFVVSTTGSRGSQQLTVSTDERGRDEARVKQGRDTDIVRDIIPNDSPIPVSAGPKETVELLNRYKNEKTKLGCTP